jgi:predicted metalloprotease with PDZ domain
MYTFNCRVPPGADRVEVAFDYLINSHGIAFFGGNSTEKVYVLNWEQVALYPHGEKPEQLIYAATLRLPPSWSFATALPVEKQGNGTVQFKPVSLYTLIDSPLNAGMYFRRFPLAPSVHPSHELDVVADSEEALDIPQDFITKYSKMVEEASALFGNHPYTQYKFLITLSDQLGHWGLEHHESSDIKMQEDMFTGDELDRFASMLVLPHEFTHTWNGKYRRPMGMITADYQDPEQTDLVWMYEGLTEYVAYLLAGRSGLLSPQEERESLAWIAAALGQPRPGRTWRTLLDTATASQLGFYPGYSEWVGWRRKNDFYWEGPLIWLDADIRIRQLTQGRKSLDDFLREFFGKAQNPIVEPYEMDDVIVSLNRVAPSDWAGFFKARVNDIAPEPPLGGIDDGGWRLAYNDQTNKWDRSLGQVNGRIILLFTLGFSTTFDGTVTDTVPGMPGVNAGIGPGMKVLAVDGRLWSPANLRSAVKRSASSKGPIELLFQNGDYVNTYHVDYHGGERQPHLVRDQTKPDLLDTIFTPLAPAK